MYYRSECYAPDPLSLRNVLYRKVARMVEIQSKQSPDKSKTQKEDAEMPVPKRY